MRYTPGTLDDSAVIARRTIKAKRAVSEANMPGKTQTYQTTSKLDTSYRAAEQAQASADLAYGYALAAHQSAQEALDFATPLPIGTVVCMSSEIAPELPGTWELWCVAQIPMTDRTLYLYERTQ